MIKPKNCEENDGAAEQPARPPGKLPEHVEANGKPNRCRARTHSANQCEENPRGMYYGGHRNRHGGERSENAFPSGWRGMREDYTLPKTRVPFVPPKPNEFFTAILIGMLRAVLAQ